MAKSIDLRTQVVHNTAVPPIKPQRVDPSGLRTPPPAQAPGVQGQLPLPMGQAVPGTRAFTPAEQAALDKIGWSAGEEIPGNIADLVNQIRDEAERILPADVGPVRPPLKLETVDIRTLSPEQQAEVTRTINESLANPSNPLPLNLANILGKPAATPPTPPASFGSQAVPGWHPPGQPDYKPQVPNPQAFPGLIPEGAFVPEDGMPEIVMDIPTGKPPAATTEPTPAPAVDPEPAMESFAGPVETHCPHCGYDTRMPDIPEPDDHEKQSFLHALLGQKPWVKEYSLLGGALKVRFRTLTVKEVDVIYKQAYYEDSHGLIPTREDYWERINRYRLYLQTSQLISAAFNHDLPDGYDRETNPNATGFWELQQPATPELTGLPQIEAYFASTIFPTESIQRIINNTCSQFNRLVARLEALVDNSDFWKPTEPQS